MLLHGTISLNTSVRFWKKSMSLVFFLFLFNNEKYHIGQLNIVMEVQTVTSTSCIVVEQPHIIHSIEKVYGWIKKNPHCLAQSATLAVCW